MGKCMYIVKTNALFFHIVQDVKALNMIVAVKVEPSRVVFGDKLRVVNAFFRAAFTAQDN